MTVGMRGKLVGIFLVLLGAWPFLLKIDKISNFFSAYKFLEYLTPGEIVYQGVLIILGVLLLWRVRVSTSLESAR
jgi:hypothetical protein